MTTGDDSKMIAELRAEIAQLREMVSSRRVGALTGKLSAGKIAKLTANGMYGDGGNLWLQVTGNGAGKSWLFRWTERGTGRERSIGLGPLKDVDLQEAREKALANRKLLLRRKDPKKVRDERILDEQIARGLAKTVRQVNEEFFEKRYAEAPLSTQRGARRYKGMINRAIGDMPIQRVDRKIFYDKTNFGELWKNKQPTANHLRVYGDLMFQYAIDQGYFTGDNPLNWERFKSQLARKRDVHKVQHAVDVPFREMPRFLEKLRAYHWGGRLRHFEGRPPISLCLEFVALSGVRPGEARLAQWKEFDFETMTWTVPWQHLKMGRDHERDRPVAITKSMLAVLEQAAQIAYPKDSSKIGDYHKNRGPIYHHARHTSDQSPEAIVFPNENNRPCDPTNLARFMREKIGWKNKEGKYCTPHGFRTTLRDWMRAKTSFRDELWQIQSDHSLGRNTSDRSYGHNQLLEERRVMMEEYDVFCTKPAPEPKADHVVKLSAKRRA